MNPWRNSQRWPRAGASA
uniref:Uncharacterized protein n=1 Tax=Rhizophora mucronata TaxID=61149 RepID=A0A2P2NBM0_RHIMU